MNSLPTRQKFPAPTGEEIRESACNVLEPQRELMPSMTELAKNLQNFPAKFPATGNSTIKPDPALAVRLI
jgi:hypothetical protein